MRMTAKEYPEMTHASSVHEIIDALKELLRLFDHQLYPFLTFYINFDGMGRVLCTFLPFPSFAELASLLSSFKIDVSAHKGSRSP